MGKKAKKNSKQAWKKSEAAKEYEKSMKELSEVQQLQNKSNESLFFEDKTGSARLRKVVFEEDIENNTPENEKRLVKNLKKKLANKPVVEKKREKSNGVYDLWDVPPPKKYDSKGFLKSEDFEISKKKSKAPRTIKTPNDFPAVSLPAAGSSYNPDKEQHQDLLGEQLAMELEFTEKIKKSKELPAGLTLSDLHNQSISPDILSSSLLFDEEDEKEDEKLLNDQSDETPYQPSKTKRITQAQRNRMKEANRIQMEAKERKKQRQLDHLLDQSKRLFKEYDEKKQQEEEEKKQEQEISSLYEKTKKPAILRGGLVHKDEIPKVDVLLTDEITNDLRTMKNVVSPIKDRFESIDRRHLVQIGGKKPVEKFAKLRKKLRKGY